MPHQRKVVRTKRLYKKHSVNRRAMNMVYFALLIIVLVALGYVVSLEWSKRFGPTAPSSVPQSTAPPVSASSTPSNSSASSESSTVSDLPAQMNGIKAVAMPQEVLADANTATLDTYLSKLKTDGFNAVYVELKTADGKIHYQTTNEKAKKYSAISPQAVDINLLVSKIKDAGLSPIAAMSTLRDATAPHVKNENSYCYNNDVGVNWLDNSVNKGGKPWLNPYMDTARSYIAELAKEMSDAGFKTIILENVMFPDINTRSMGLVKQTKSYAEILAQLVDEVVTAAGDAQVLVEYSSEQVIPTVNNAYYVSAKDIGYKNAAIAIDEAAITRLYNSMKQDQTIDKSLPTEEGKLEVVKFLLDRARSDIGADIIPIVRDKVLLATIEPTLALYNFKNIFTGGK